MGAFPTQKKGQVADIAFLLEGTYPYIRGGVSSWVHQLIRGLPELTFSIAFLGGARDMYGEVRYELPDNLIHLEVHYLMESWGSLVPRSTRGNRKAFDQINSLHDFFRDPEVGMSDELFRKAMTLVGRKRGGISRHDFLYSKQTWNRITDQYTNHCTDPSFLDYFWTVRTMHAPLFTLAKMAKTFPPARVFHAVSTGYAGLLGVMLRNARERPYILTEHGIYTKERRIDLAHAEWIKEFRDTFGGGLDERVGYIRQLWIRFFEGLGRLTYAGADPIIALYEGNRQRQVDDGAPEHKTQVIPNGISVEKLSPLRKERAPGVPKVIGLIGRVVPIKDIRTFIRAMRSVITRMPEVEGWVIGPDEEDMDYAKECKELVRSLGLEEKVKFLGFQKISDMLPKMGINILTSISEGQPLVTLEGFAAGVPCLATDVGSCRELIEGRTEEDRALGMAGRVVPIASPEATADAAIELLSDEETWFSAQRAAIDRVEKYYNEPLLFKNYREIYGTALEASP